MVIIAKVATVKINAAQVGKKASGQLGSAFTLTGYAIVVGEKTKALGKGVDLRSRRKDKHG
jgi:hypothetical protein